MIHIKEKEKCYGCYSCLNACPVGCISFSMDKEGFFYPEVDAQRCINCNLCNQVCPIENNVEVKNDYHQAFACVNKNASIQMKSSSGGVFFSLAKYVVDQGGVVYGAAFDEKMRLVTKKATNVNEIYPLLSSKYVQSEVGKAYQEIKNYIDVGQIVLFIGTGCQIAGLKRYLKNKPYNNLLLVDFICHGVPAPGVWKSYVSYREKNVQSKMVTAEFRNKHRNWRQYYAVYTYENGKTERVHRSDNPYHWSFLKNYTLRPSCFDCHFKGIERESDITIGDFWSVKQYINDMDDKKGVSLVIVHTKKGIGMFEKIKKELLIQEVDHDSVVSVNIPYLESVKCPNNRVNFYDVLAENGWEGIKNEWFPERSIFAKAKDFLRALK